MSSIYTSSKRLLVWLGVEGQGSDQAMEFIARLGRKTLQDKNNTTGWLLQESTSPSYPQTLESIAQLLTRPWFTRVWILQEYVLGGSDDTLFMCGRMTVSGKTLFAVFPDHYLSEALPETDNDALALLQMEMRIMLLAATKRLAQLCSANIARKFCISRIDIHGERGRDFTLEDAKSLTYWLEVNRPTMLKIRETNASARIKCIARFAQDLSTLSIQGSIWDIIGFTFAAEVHPPDGLSELQTCCKTIWNHVHKFQLYGSEVDTKQAFWRTLLSDPLGYRYWNDWGATERALADTGTSYRSHFDQVYEYGMNLDSLLHEVNLKESSTQLDAAIDLFNKVNARLRTLLTTRRGYVGQTLYEERVREGDLVCVLLGCSIPMLLRPIQDHYELVGEVYLDGIMYGEAMKALDEGKVQIQTFELH